MWIVILILGYFQGIFYQIVRPSLPLCINVTFNNVLGWTGWCYVSPFVFTCALHALSVLAVIWGFIYGNFSLYISYMDDDMILHKRFVHI